MTWLLLVITKSTKNLTSDLRLLGQTIAESLVDLKQVKSLLKLVLKMTRDVIDSIIEYLDDLNKFMPYTKWLCGGYKNYCSSKFKVVAPNDPDRVVTIVGNANPDDKVRALTTWQSIAG